MPGVNTISADLQRTAILKETVRAFAKRVLPLRLFSTAFYNVALQGTDEAVVPYFPLQPGASTDFVQANGYVFAGATNSSSKKISVNKRKYMPLDFSSSELSRQPGLGLAGLWRMNAEKLAVDVLTDILSAITAANYGAAAYVGAAATYTADKIADLRGVANAANWPDTGRSLIVDSTVDTQLLKDTAYKLSLNIGTSSVIQEGTFPKLSGFDYAMMPSFPANGENLLGCIAHPSALLIAFAPVEPTPDVRNRLSAYEVISDAETGISLTYRRWGSADADVSREVLECSYGFSVGEAAALKRLTSA